VPWRFGEIEPDFIVGAAAAVLYISVQYHLLNPGYLRARLLALSDKFRVRILLVHVDVDDSQSALHKLTQLAFAEKWSLVCGWSREEVARYIETFKLYENRSADLIQGRTDDDYTSKLTSCLTAVRLVNKTDVTTLASTFGTLRAIMTAPAHEIKLCPGIGQQKAAQLAGVLQEPFLASRSQRPAQPQHQAAAIQADGAPAAQAAPDPPAAEPYASFGLVVRQQGRAWTVHCGRECGNLAVVQVAEEGVTEWEALAARAGSLPPNTPACTWQSAVLLFFQFDPAFGRPRTLLGSNACITIHGEGGSAPVPPASQNGANDEQDGGCCWAPGHSLGDLLPPPPPSWLVQAAKEVCAAG